jgi:hypothetical protein
MFTGDLVMDFLKVIGFAYLISIGLAVILIFWANKSAEHKEE